MTTSTTVKAGDTLEGRYKILNLVGEGGMGTVWMAEHMLIKRRVAIKILRPELAADANVVDRFMNEARAAGAIGHPHIVESTDMGFTRDEVPFIVFEYLEGTLLTDEIYRTKGMSVRRALRIAGQIASALHAAHQAGIVHRDLKSDNIFLTDKEDASDHVKVLDFGISRFLETDSSDSSNNRQVMGTPEFMAPEQITAPESVDKRVDIYALGVVLYEMLTARRPFDFDGPMTGDTRTFEETDRLLHKILTDSVTPMHRPDLPPGLEDLIQERLLAKNPDERFQSMKDVQAALEAFFGVARRDSVPVEPIATALPPAAEAVTLPQPAKKRTGLYIGIGVLALAGIGGGAFVMMNKQPPANASSTNNTAQQVTANDPKRSLQDAVDRFCDKLDSIAQASKMRVQGIASLPMLRAAIETDAATLADMVQDKDVIFQAQPGETLEIFQERDGKKTSMLRIPAASGAVQPPASVDTAYLESTGTELLLITSTPVSNQKGANQGIAVLAARVDIGQLQQSFTTKGDAAIVGLAKPIVLAGSAPTGGTQLVCKTSPQTNLSVTISAKTK